MRLYDYMYENKVKDALGLDEPEIGDEYSEEYVNKMISQLTSALSQAKKDSYVDDDAKNAIVSDIESKLDKWQNVDSETESPKKSSGGEEGEGEEDLEGEEGEGEEDLEDEDLEDEEEDEEDLEDEDLEESNKMIRKINSRIRRLK